MNTNNSANSINAVNAEHRKYLTTPALKNFLIPYFKESFFYWDHLNLDKELIEWFKPDIIIEIRIERFLENYEYPDWIKKQEKLH